MQALDEEDHAHDSSDKGGNQDQAGSVFPHCTSHPAQQQRKGHGGRNQTQAPGQKAEPADSALRVHQLVCEGEGVVHAGFLCRDKA
ncbi:hypothetical protein D3C71_1922960 [compost metagenome]